MNKNYRIALFVLFPLMFEISAQDLPKELNLDGKEFVIDKSRTNELPEASRNFEKIIVKPEENKRPPLIYDFKDDYKIQLADVTTKIRVSTIKSDEIEKLYAHLAQIGYGNYSTLFMDLRTGSKRNDQYAYYAHYGHLSSARGPVDKSNSANGTNVLEAGGSYFLNNHTLNANFIYNRNRVNFYGYQIAPADKSNLKQLIKTVELNISSKGSIIDSVSKYTSFLKIINVSDHYKAKEFLIDGALNTYYKIKTKSKINLDFDYLTNTQKDSSSVKRNLIGILPSFEQIVTNFVVKGGVKIDYENDTIDKKNLHFYPVLSVDYKLKDKVHYLQLGLDGGIKRKTLLSTLKENPFIKSNTQIYHTNNLYNVYIGSRSNWFSKIHTITKISYGKFKNMDFYINSVDSSRFDIVYNTDITVSRLRTELECKYKLKNILGLGFQVAYNHYSMEKMSPWHKPNLEAILNTELKLKDKVLFNLDFYYIGGLKSISPSSKLENTLKPITDLNIKTEYRFSKMLGTWVEVNNILGSNNQRYMYYVSKGLNFMVGVNFSF